MNKEIEILKSRIKNTKNNIFSLFKVETISNLIIYFEQLQIENEQLREEIKRLKEKIKIANKKIEKMFDIGDENKIIDDLLELQKILEKERKSRKEAISWLTEYKKQWDIDDEVLEDMDKLLDILDKGE